ncbi:MAG: DUF4390 domain-containing protein [Magnetococcales bacterium]|nr:DUF4390 domain-containing protein [Magnetococcales bacterium]
MLRLLLVSVLWLLQGCASVTVDPVDTASASVHDGRLYVEAVLKPAFVQQLMARVQQGELITARYQLRLYRVQDWWLDQELVDRDITHRLRFHLITERFEMQEEGGPVAYSDDSDEAVRFLSTIRELLLQQVVAGDMYRIEVRFQMEPNNVPWLFHVLHRMVGFSQSPDAVHVLTQRVEGRHP